MAKKCCLKCKRNVFMNGFCRQHFLENIEKRVKKEIRQNNLIDKDDVLSVKDPLCVYFIKNINVPVKIIKSSSKSSRKNAKEILPWTMDDEILLFLNAFFSKKSLKGIWLGQDSRKIKLFRTIRDAELSRYANLRGIRFSKKRGKADRKIMDEIDRLEKMHAETRFSILKSIEQILRII